MENYDDYIVALHWQGMSSYRIAKLLKISQATVSRHLKALHLKPQGKLKHRKNLLKNYRMEIIQSYLSGIGCSTLAKEYRASESSILNLLRKNNIKIRN